MKHNKNLILSLIKDDLILTQFITGLNKLGLDAGNYYLHLSQTIFNLMGFGDFKQEQKLYEDYFDFVEKASTVNLLEHPKQLNKIALEVYDKLMTEKEKRKTHKIIKQPPLKTASLKH